MNVKWQLYVHTLKHRRLIFTSIVVFIILQLLFSIQLIASTLSYDKIYKGIYINDVYVSGMTPKEAEELLEQTYGPRLESMNLTLKSDQLTKRISPKKIVKSLNVQESVEEAYNQGRGGNFVSRLFSITSTSTRGKNLKIEYKYDEANIQHLMGKISPKVKKDLISSSYQIYEDKIVINPGRPGQSLDEAKLRQALLDQIESLETEDIEIPILVVQPEPVNIDELYAKVHVEAKDAAYEVKDHKITIVSHVIGRNFNMEKAKELLSSKQQDGVPVEIPLTLTYPEVYEKELTDSLFKDTLSSFSTRYNQSEKDRSENIRLAAAKINGVILAPGEVFSYNQIVGKRTSEAGFKEAHVYMGGRIVDGIGGGICQVSTTLYNAVLFTDLEVVERKNHNMTVSYVPPGRDATVSYGSIDFKFRNNYKNPIKLITAAGGGVLKIDILGINESPSKKIELVTEKLETYTLPEKVIEDSNLPVGYSKVVQKGMKGYKVNTYKVVKENGKVISKTKISTNKYSPLQRIVKKGTKGEE